MKRLPGVCVVVAVLAGMLACSGPSRAAPQRPAPGVGPAPATAADRAGSGAQAPGGKGAGKAPLLDPAGTSCDVAACAYHAGVGRTFVCLAGGAGACFHFGAPCQPADDCMLDGSDGTYKRCTQAVDGACLRFAGACAPQGSCWFRPDEGLYRECTQRKPGACGQWGALCKPSVAPK